MGGLFQGALFVMIAGDDGHNHENASLYDPTRSLLLKYITSG